MHNLNNPRKVLSTWVKHLYRLVDCLNDTVMQMIRMKPKDTIELKEVPLVESYSPEDTLPEDRLHQYLLQPSKEHDDQCKRASDTIWLKGTYRLSAFMSSHGYRVMYYLNTGPERAFMKEELMLIPEDTELLPDYVQKW